MSDVYFSKSINLQNTCLHSHAEHGILFSVIISRVDTEQRSKVVLVHSLLIFVDPVSPLGLCLVGLKMIFVQVLHVDFRERLFEISIDFVINSVRYWSVLDKYAEVNFSTRSLSFDFTYPVKRSLEPSMEEISLK